MTSCDSPGHTGAQADRRQTSLHTTCPQHLAASGGRQPSGTSSAQSAFLDSRREANAQPPALPAESPVVATAVRQHLILVIGAPGTNEYKEVFQTWATRWQDAAKRADADCTVIGNTEAPANDLEKLALSISETVAVETTEPLWIVFIGHGTFDGRTASLNLNGPDVSAEKIGRTASACETPDCIHRLRIVFLAIH